MEAVEDFCYDQFGQRALWRHLEMRDHRDAMETMTVESQKVSSHESDLLKQQCCWQDEQEQSGTVCVQSIAQMELVTQYHRREIAGKAHHPVFAHDVGL